MKRLTQFTITTLLAILVTSSAEASRIEELCDVRGVRSNQLVGYGLVVGLSWTGDRGLALFTVQSTAAMLRRLGATIDPDAIETRNAAAVIVTATLPGFAQPGARIDATVSSLGNARSLEGGTLIRTPLFAADRRAYAVAQGPLLIGGFAARGRSGSIVRQNYTTVGRIPAGAIVERRAPTPELSRSGLVLQLRSPSFVTATRVAAAINEEVGEGTATAVDAGTVRVAVSGEHRDDPVGLLAVVQLLDVEPDNPVRVIIDERTGTVVLGSGVRISEVAVAQGGLTVEIGESSQVSQPGALAEGDTAVVEETQVQATVQPGSMHHIGATASLAEVVTALNALGARPRNLMAIFQALRAAGALQAEIRVQ